jgi:hypothetical protein
MMYLNLKLNTSVASLKQLIVQKWYIAYNVALITIHYFYLNWFYSGEYEMKNTGPILAPSHSFTSLTKVNSLYMNTNIL